MKTKQGQNIACEMKDRVQLGGRRSLKEMI
jgi:hypothetical protein